DEHVAWLEVAVYDKILMSMVHCQTERSEHAQAIFNGHLLRVAILVDGQTLDILHDNVRVAIGSLAAIKQSSDVGVIEGCQDLSLLAKPPEDAIGIAAA